VKVTLPEAAALFRRAGYDKAMPYQKWAHNLITQPSRQLAQESAGKYSGCVTARAHLTLYVHVALQCL
jgi:hypothetical protein